MISRHSLIPVLAGIVFSLATPPAGAQEVNFSGQWAPIYHEDGQERLPGPTVGDYMGLPLNEAARLRADSYDADRISSVHEYQCRQEPPDYALRGNAAMRITADLDPLTQRIAAFHTRQGFNDAERTIYLDGRPHPPATAPHSWPGFSTGVWEGNMLIITTTHLKAFVHRRNGVPSSDTRTLTERWVRHGNFWTAISTTVDPVFLTEPLVRSQSWAIDPAGGPMGTVWCIGAPEIVLEAGAVPNWLPGANPYLKEASEMYGVPYEASRGGANTLYPEYRETFKQTWSALDRCTKYCTCMNVGNGCPFTAPPTPPRPAAPARE